MNLRSKRKSTDAVQELSVKKGLVTDKQVIYHDCTTEPTSVEDELRKEIEGLKKMQAASKKQAADYKKQMEKSEKKALKLERLNDANKKKIMNEQLTHTRSEISEYREALEKEATSLKEQRQELLQLRVETQMAIPVDDQRVLSTMSCLVCLAYYNINKHPYFGDCGHSLCQSCIEILPAKDCPACRRLASFAFPKKNYLATDMIEVFTERGSISQTSFRA